MNHALHKSALLHTRRAKFSVSLLALLAAYVMGSRALDTGSLGQYGLTLALLFFAIKYFYRSVRSA